MKELTATVECYALGEAQMVEFGRHLGICCGGRAVLFLEGDLGVGKTTLCRGVLQAYGYRGVVKSPTYTLVEPYELDDTVIYHFDLYRLADPEELEYMGIRDYFDGNAICLVEWPARGQGYLPQPDLEIKVAVSGEGRHIACSACTTIGKKMLVQLQSALGA